MAMTQKTKKNTVPLYKTITINASEAIVDGNSNQVPCLMEYVPKLVTKGNGEQIRQYVMSMKYTWSTWERNKKITRGIEVLGGKYGVPTLRDYDVLLALQRLFLKQKLEENNGKLKTENLTTNDLTFIYTIDMLCKEMGYNSPSTVTREWIKNSIITLTTSSLRNLDSSDGKEYCGGLYDIRNKRYIDRSMVVHYFEKAAGHLESISDKRAKTRAYIVFSEFLYDAMVNNYLVYYNTAKCVSIKNYTAKRIYCIYEQWRGRKKSVHMTFKTLMERIPTIDEMKPAAHKAFIKKALKHLSDKNYLTVTIDGEDITLSEPLKALEEKKTKK